MEVIYFVIETVFASALDFFFLPVPGFEDLGLSFLSLFLGIAFISVSVRFVLNVLGIGSTAGSLPVNSTIRSGRGKNK